MQMLHETNPSLADAQAAVFSVCNELDYRVLHKSPFIPISGAYSKLTNMFSFTVLEDIPTALLMGGDQTLKQYKEKLAKISEIDNTIERIKETYELTMKSEGASDEVFDSSGKPTPENWHDLYHHNTPEDVLDAAIKTGKGGVCRDMSMLLAWSLEQVNVSSHPNWSSMDNRLFLVRRMYGAGHVWVQITLPSQNGHEPITIDLDTTLYHDRFTPVFERFKETSDAENQHLFDECVHVFTCLRDTNKPKTP